jgi:hypothetical protein
LGLLCPVDIPYACSDFAPVAFHNAILTKGFEQLTQSARIRSVLAMAIHRQQRVAENAGTPLLC